MNSREIAQATQAGNGADVGRVLLALGLLALLAWMNDSRPAQTATPDAAIAQIESRD
jgi:hypothetical protein